MSKVRDDRIAVHKGEQRRGAEGSLRASGFIADGTEHIDLSNKCKETNAWGKRVEHPRP